jgi:hypothetical protein
LAQAIELLWTRQICKLSAKFSNTSSASAQMCWQAARSMSSAALKTNYVQNEPNFA